MASSLKADVAAGLALLATACVHPKTDLLGEFETVLASRPSASEALQHWCGRRKLAEPPAISAHPVKSPPLEASAEVRDWLDVGEETPVEYRHVELACGDVVMSRARNWYVPSRLTPAMNEALQSTDTPFGQVVKPLGFTRQRLESKRGATADCPAGTILSHRAVLNGPDGKPISLVVECYTRANLGGG